MSDHPNTFDPVTQPNQYALAEHLRGEIAKHGPMAVHATWGEGAAGLTTEQRAGEVLGMLNSPTVSDPDLF